MAVEVQTLTPVSTPSSWTWEDECPFERQAYSPVFRGRNLNDWGTLLAPMESFLLDGEVLPHEPPSAPVPVVPASQAHPLPAARTNLDIEMFVENTFDEMDEALARGGHESSGAHAQSTTPPVYEPNGEEQAWLDMEWDRGCDHVYDEARDGEYDEADVTLMGDTSSGVEVDECEESWVRALLAAHPAIDEEEARWLWEQRHAAR